MKFANTLSPVERFWPIAIPVAEVLSPAQRRAMRSIRHSQDGALVVRCSARIADQLDAFGCVDMCTGQVRVTPFGSAVAFFLGADIY